MTYSTLSMLVISALRHALLVTLLNSFFLICDGTPKTTNLSVLLVLALAARLICSIKDDGVVAGLVVGDASVDSVVVLVLLVVGVGVGVCFLVCWLVSCDGLPLLSLTALSNLSLRPLRE